MTMGVDFWRLSPAGLDPSALVVGRPTGKDVLALRWIAFDSADQNKGVAYTTGTGFIQERRTEPLGRCVMLTVMYCLG